MPFRVADRRDRRIVVSRGPAPNGASHPEMIHMTTTTKITGLTQDQSNALAHMWHNAWPDNQTGRPYEVTPTTASFRGDAADAWQWVAETLSNAGYPTRGYPRQALQSVIRKLRKLDDTQRAALEDEVTRQLAVYEPEMAAYAQSAFEHEADSHDAEGRF